MADDGVPDPEEVRRQLEDQLREVRERLQTPPDEAQCLLELLKEVEECLLKVEQSPPESTWDAFRPATEALVKKELIGHSDPNVKLAVASCISEITRITAPIAPYDDDAMRNIFSLIVGTFQHLDDIENPSFEKRVAILDTVGKIRSCVVMLDLECDDLINDMFHHFLRTVSSQHSDFVISCMETIMRLVIEESEDIQPQIASCLLQNVRKEEKSLKGTSLSEYSQFIAIVCEEGSDDREDNNADPSGNNTVDDGKPSERTISDKLPEELSKVEQDVSCPKQDGSSMNGNTADTGTESIAAEPKNKSAVDADKSIKLNPLDKSEATAHSGADTKKHPVASGEEGPMEQLLIHQSMLILHLLNQDGPASWGKVIGEKCCWKE